jgi:hypothetical protein
MGNFWNLKKTALIEKFYSGKKVATKMDNFWNLKKTAQRKKMI